MSSLSAVMAGYTRTSFLPMTLRCVKIQNLILGCKSHIPHAQDSGRGDLKGNTVAFEGSSQGPRSALTLLLQAQPVPTMTNFPATTQT